MVSFMLVYSFISAVTLQWDPNLESNLAGYKCYYKHRTSTAVFQMYTAVPHSTTTCTLQNLSSSRKYEFRVTAYNTSGQESGFSNRVTVGDKIIHHKMKKFTGSVICPTL